ncbi:hypothetical protein [Chondromyces crocatus]|uniref:Bacterial virulence factor lipase N-terminal domain-containing protein n=1 Tax=Chondromyces crocatus TaxID=52 RepID=A0A0K1E5I4_CHOCO|nr:hypothetical protein [Chondromyces crocatus]AKT36130.1 uncharacterized protein CMC5_002430 [Chondromyces crocatus]
MNKAPRRTLSALALVLGSFAAACGGDDSVDSPQPLAIPEGCNPIAYQSDCLLPYPSDFFLTEDPSTPTGRRVRLSDAAAPRDKNARTFDFMQRHPVDGFSHHMPILAIFPEGVDAQKLTFHTDDPAAALRADSTTLLVDADTGQLVPHWAELDRSTDKEASRALIVRPYVKLQNRHRYIVAFQGLVDLQGQPIKPPVGFDRIRDASASAEPALSAQATHYEQAIFPVLEAAGVTRANLQLAWDFTVGSEEWLTQDMLAIRDDAIQRMTQTPPAITVTSVQDMPEDPNIAVRIEGTLRVPLYLESVDTGAAIHRGSDGRPAANGETEVPFLLQVPRSALPDDANFEPARILQYGHGFFGLREEINYGFMRDFTNEQRYVTASVDWWGMSEPDIIATAADILSDVGVMFRFVDRLHQAMVNMIALSYAVKGGLADLPELQRFDKPLFDKEQLYYYGISQGAIFGVTLLSLSPTLERAALSVGGGPYSLMMSRSASYTELLGLLSTVIDEPLTLQKIMALSQHTWDRVDPITYSGRVLQDPYPNSPAGRRLLLQVGIGDHSVNNLASHLNARALGVPLLDPSPRAVYGLATTTAPADDALVLVDFKLENEPGIDARVPTAEEKNDVHEGVRRNPRIKQQLDAFFQPDGRIEHFCDGVCDPE